MRKMSHCSPLDGTDDATAVSGGALPSNAQLSLLEFIPPGPKSGTRDLTPPFLLASFLYLAESFESGVSQTTQFTVICRWDLQIVSSKLHVCLDSLSSKKGGASANLDLPVSYLSLLISPSRAESNVEYQGRTSVKKIE